MYQHHGIGLAAIQVGYQLRIPGKQGDVKRHLRIILKYQDQDGKEQRKTFYNLEARCIQHEMDHLEGKLCIDYEKGEYSRDKHKS